MWGVAWRNIKRYVKHDLKEIAFPSSLPNPPHVKAKPKPRKLTVKDYVYVCRSTALSLRNFFSCRRALFASSGEFEGGLGRICA
jgi:hypothetical protein